MRKDISRFSKYDVVLTSYGITRLDVELFQVLFQLYYS